MSIKRQKIGKYGESAATEFLKQNGYTIIERNYRCKLGEIDIIALDKETIAFIEVRVKKTYKFGHPKATITPKKMRKISLTALYYLKINNKLNNKARFDVVAISLFEPENKIELIKNAFNLKY